MLMGSSLPAIEINRPAPAFSLATLSKGQRALEDYKGKVVLINFWASWCGPCQEELPALNKLAADYEPRKVKILAISVDENPAEATALLAKLHLPTSRMDIFLDTKSKVVSTYNIASMPSSFILDSKGIIRFVHPGFRTSDSAAWRREIESLLNAPNK